MNARPHSAEGHAAAGRLYGRRGARPVMKSHVPPTNAERRSRWAALYQSLPELERRQVVAVMPTSQRQERRETAILPATAANPLGAPGAGHDEPGDFSEASP